MNDNKKRKALADFFRSVAARHNTDFNLDGIAADIDSQTDFGKSLYKSFEEKAKADGETFENTLANLSDDEVLHIWPEDPTLINVLRKIEFVTAIGRNRVITAEESEQMINEWEKEDDELAHRFGLIGPS